VVLPCFFQFDDPVDQQFSVVLSARLDPRELSVQQIHRMPELLRDQIGFGA
jgi:hypothetical protein